MTAPITPEFLPQRKEIQEIEPNRKEIQPNHLQEIPLAARIIGNTIGLGIGMGKIFGLTFGINSGINFIFGSNPLTSLTPLHIAILSSVTGGVSMVSSESLKKGLKCRANTPWRNTTSIIATSIAGSLAASLVFNKLGYEKDPYTLIQNNFIMLGISSAVQILQLAQLYLKSEENTKTLDPNRVKPLNNTQVKVHQLQQTLLSEPNLNAKVA